MAKKRRASPRHPDSTTADIVEILDASRRVAARSVNAAMTATYWAVGRRIAEQDRGGGERGGRGPLSEAHLTRIAAELSARFGRGYSVRALRTMAAFFAAYHGLPPTSRVAERPLALGNYFDELRAVAAAFPLSWSHYVQLVKVADPNARGFYECEALRRGWTVRQLAAQIRARVYQRGQPSQSRPLAPPPPPMPGLPDEILRDPYLRQFFHVPPGEDVTRGRTSLATWLSRARGARDGSPAWLQ